VPSPATDPIPWRKHARELHCARIVRAMAATVCEQQGYAGVQVASVCARAGVSRATFFKVFDSRESCFTAVLDEGYRGASAAVCHALQRADDWLDGVRLALAASLSFFDAEPQLARACLVESLAAGPWALKRGEAHVAALTRSIAARWEGRAPQEPYPFTNAGIMASLLGIIRNHLLANRPGPLIGLLGPLTGLATSPYLDTHAIAEQVERSSALAAELLNGRDSGLVRREDHAPEMPDLLLNPRAHRARECVLSLAEQPGASNRQVATAIGVASHTQISALLGRLARAGLLVKDQGRPGRPNAWSLTACGAQIAQALREEEVGAHISRSADIPVTLAQRRTNFTVTS
jgi:AcrR family transcriptional regulator/transposase